MTFRLTVRCNGWRETAGRENYWAVTTICGGGNNRKERGATRRLFCAFRNDDELSPKDVGVIYYIYRTPDVTRFVFFVSSFDKSPFIAGRTAAPPHVRPRRLYTHARMITNSHDAFSRAPINLPGSVARVYGGGIIHTDGREMARR